MRKLWFSIAICGVALCILTGLVLLNVTVPGDLEMVSWAVSHRYDRLTFLIEGLTFISSATPALLMTIGVSLVEMWRHRRLELSAGWSTLAYMGTVICNIGLRVMVERQRPAVSYIPHVLPEIQAGFQRFCYPSGHAGAALVAFASLSIMMWPLPRLRRIAFAGCMLLIIGVGFGRVYMGVHWPTDVLAGYLLGTIWLAVGLWVRQLGEELPIFSQGRGGGQVDEVVKREKVD